MARLPGKAPVLKRACVNTLSRCSLSLKVGARKHEAQIVSGQELRHEPFVINKNIVVVISWLIDLYVYKPALDLQGWPGCSGASAALPACLAPSSGPVFPRRSRVQPSVS